MSKRGQQRAETDDERINWCQTPSGVELYDETNPDAWIHLEFTAGVQPEHQLYMICPDCGAVVAQRGKPGNATVCGDCGTVFDHDD